MHILRAILFDVDGTLLDTEDLHRQCFNRAFRHFQLDWHWNPAHYAELLAISGGRERLYWFGRGLKSRFANEGEYERFIAVLHQEKGRMYRETLAQGELPLRPGVLRLILEAEQAGLPVAIATCTSSANVQALLTPHLGSEWRKRFSAIATADEVDQKKPAPAVYRHLVQQLNLPPNACVAIEDTVNGLKAATGAGVATVVTVNRYTAHRRFDGAALVVDHLGEPWRPCHTLSGPPTRMVDLDTLDTLLAAQAEAASAHRADPSPRAPPAPQPAAEPRSLAPRRDLPGPALIAHPTALVARPIERSGERSGEPSNSPAAPGGDETGIGPMALLGGPPPRRAVAGAR